MEVFCKVVDLSSFTKAGKALSLSQPTVSEHIRALEDELGEKLIDRLGREAVPTPVGRVFYGYARSIIQSRDDAVQAIEQFRGRLAGRLVLGASSIPGTYLLPRLIGGFKSSHPAIRITLTISDTAQIAEKVLERDLEAGVIGSKWNDRRLASEELLSDELVLAVFPEHPWANRASVRPDQLLGEQFIIRERGSGTRMVMEKILEAHGVDPSRLTVVAEMGSTEAVRQGIKSRIGISIISCHAVADDVLHGALAQVRIRGVSFKRPLYLVQRKNLQISPVCQAFLEHVRKDRARNDASPL